ncbi:hypothetical protein DY000_02004277 [Brassica cretica]|uniref:Uncharacterized protein n=1 Tax=Brassica cretica TaxID=69181 RepID=A0ABQ7CEN1_BRACR|nr:hypothetical protein DY000_02004277 [Brassica cretica]
MQVLRPGAPFLTTSGSTGSEIFWGVPQPVESLAGYSRRSSSTLVCYYAYLSLEEYPPLVGVDTIHPSGVAPHLQDPSPSPPPELSVSSKFLSPQLFKKSFGVLPPPSLISPSVGQRPEPMNWLSPDLSYLLTHRRTFILPTRFSELFTEAGSPYLSYTKSLMFAQSPMGSPGSPSSPLAYFCREKRTFSSTTSLLRSVSLPNIKWKCSSISITVLLSCVAARLGPEDATDFVSTIF